MAYAPALAVFKGICLVDDDDIHHEALMQKQRSERVRDAFAALAMPERR